MEAILTIFIITVLPFISGVIIGTNTAEPQIRRDVVNFCVEFPRDCATEHQFYQLQDKLSKTKKGEEV